MALWRSDICKYPALHPAVTASQAGVTFASKGKIVLTTALAINEIVLLCRLPPYHQPVDFKFECGQLDSGAGSATIEVTFGIANSGLDDLVADSDFVTTEQDTFKTGGVYRADVQAKGLALAASTSDRYLAAKVVTAGHTKVEGTLIGTLTYCQNPS